MTADTLEEIATNDLISAIIHQMEMKIDTSIDPIHHAASFLDPAFKSFDFSDQPEDMIKTAKQFIEDFARSRDILDDEVVII